MKQTTTTLLLLLALATSASARIRYVDPAGILGKQSIQAVINDCVDGDTVRILEGSYPENIVIPLNIVVQGAGAENTFLHSSTGYTCTITSGKIMWLTISGSVSAVSMQAATVTNCIIEGCGGDGIDIAGNGASVVNCIILGNGVSGIAGGIAGDPSGTSVFSVTNCILIDNKQNSIHGDYSQSGSERYCIEFNNASGAWGMKQVSCLSSDPVLASNGTWHLSSGSPCIDAGDPTLLDLDGTRSDIGYYGGPDAPLMPYIAPPQFPAGSLQADGTIQFNLTGKVGY